MTVLELWTNVRFLLYPIMFGAALAWSLFHLRAWRHGRCTGDAWAFWLGVAVAINGLAGVFSLLVARTVGFGPISSSLFTIGPAVLTIVIVAGAASLFWAAWKR